MVPRRGMLRPAVRVKAGAAHCASPMFLDLDFPPSMPCRCAGVNTARSAGQEPGSSVLVGPAVPLGAPAPPDEADRF
jgi:hypothetical protein